MSPGWVVHICRLYANHYTVPGSRGPAPKIPGESPWRHSRSAVHRESIRRWPTRRMPLTGGGSAGAGGPVTPLSVADADEMAGVLAGDELYAFTGGSPPALDELRARCARQVVGRSPDGSEEWHNWIIRGQADGYVQATVTDEGRRAEIAWVVGLHRQGQGYASEAARAAADRLRARCRFRPGAHPPRARRLRRRGPPGGSASHRSLRRRRAALAVAARGRSVTRVRTAGTAVRAAGTSAVRSGRLPRSRRPCPPGPGGAGR